MASPIPETQKGAADERTKAGLSLPGLLACRAGRAPPPQRSSATLALRPECACSQVTWPYALWERNFQVSQSLVLNLVFDWYHGTFWRSISCLKWMQCTSESFCPNKMVALLLSLLEFWNLPVSILRTPHIYQNGDQPNSWAPIFILPSKLKYFAAFSEVWVKREDAIIVKVNQVNRIIIVKSINLSDNFVLFCRLHCCCCVSPNI